MCPFSRASNVRAEKNVASFPISSQSLDCDCPSWSLQISLEPASARLAIRVSSPVEAPPTTLPFVYCSLGVFLRSLLGRIRRLAFLFAFGRLGFLLTLFGFVRIYEPLLIQFRRRHHFTSIVTCLVNHITRILKGQ